MDAYFFTVTHYDDGEEMDERGYVFASSFSEAADRVVGVYGEENVGSVEIAFEEADVSGPLIFMTEDRKEFYFL